VKEQTMIIMMSENRMRRTAKRMQKILVSLGVNFRYTACLQLAAQLHEFESWNSYLQRDLEAPLSLLDEELDEVEFLARDAFQMAVLEAAGLGAIARELLERANPTGSWASQRTEDPIVPAITGNDPQ
jgi:hypothetical protein